MKTVTGPYLTAVRTRFGYRPVKLVKAYYNASSFVLIAPKKYVIGADTYQPWLKTVGDISYSLPDLPGLGSIMDCKITIARNATTDQFLTGICEGQKVTIWQWFEDLADADKLGLATDLTIRQVESIKISSFVLDCVSDIKLRMPLPDKDLNKTAFPNMPDDNIGIARPVVLGDFRACMTDGSSSGRSTPSWKREQYIQCKRPNRVPPPAFWVQMNTSPDTGDVKQLIVHESVDSLSILADSEATLGGQEFMRYFPALDLYGFCRNEDAGAGLYPWKTWVQVNNGGQTLINKNIYSDVDSFRGGQFVTLYVPASAGDILNNVTNYFNAYKIPLNVANILTGHILNLMFESKGKPVGFGLRRYLTFSISGMTATNLNVQISYDGGVTYDPTQLNIAGPLTGGVWTHYEWQLGNPIDLANEFFDTGKLKVRFQPSGGAANLGGVAIKLIFRDFEDSTERRVKWGPRQGPSWDPVIFSDKFTKQEPNFSNVYFYATKGVDVVTDGKSAYDYRHPIYALQYLLRKVMGYGSAEMGYTSMDNVNIDLASISEGGVFPNTWKNFGHSIASVQSATDVLSNLVQQMGCWLWWGAEGKWQLMRLNFELLLPNDVRIFSDKYPDPGLTPDTIYPMWNFISRRTAKIYNRFELSADFEFARGIYRNKTIFDRNNTSELATSFNQYGYEEIYPQTEFNWFRSSGLADNFYQVVRIFKDPRIEIEFDTNLCASYLEVGDNIKVNHTNQTWAAPTPTTGKQFQIKGHSTKGNTIHIKAVEIIP